MSQGQTQRPARLYRERNLQILFGITLMVVLGVSTVAPALPRMGEELALPAQSLGWLITFFTLPGALLGPLFGVLADRLGRKRVLIPALLVFALSGGACGLTGDFRLMLGLRFLQGLGAAAMGMLGLTIIGDLYQGRDRAEAMGYAAGVLNLGLAVYPALGGALATLSWRYPFLLPFLGLPLALAARRLDNPEPRATQSFGEYLKATLAIVGRGHVLALMATGVGAFVIIYGAIVVYLPFFLDRSLAAGPLTIGLILSFSSLISALVASQLGRLIEAMSQKRLLGISFCLYAAASLMVPLVSSLWAALVPAAIFGLAQGASLPVIQNLLTGLAPAQNRAAVVSLFGMALRGGQTVGPLLMGLVFGWWGLSQVFLAAAAVSLLVLGLVAASTR